MVGWLKNEDSVLRRLGLTWINKWKTTYANILATIFHGIRNHNRPPLDAFDLASHCTGLAPNRRHYGLWILCLRFVATWTATQATLG